MENNWQNRLGIKRKLKRAIKALKLGTLTPGDAEAIGILRTAQNAASHDRTFAESLTLRQEQNKRRKKRRNTSHGAQPSSGLVRHSGKAASA